MLVLYGPEGIRKSSFLRILGGDWYASTMMDPRNKDALHQVRGVWLYEWQEMEALQRARDSDAVKAFLTDRTDHYRPSHEPDVEDVPRNGVFCGTTNQQSFLTELTGDRRFWPITCPAMIDVDLLATWRDQLWAEADRAFQEGEKWYLTDDEKGWLEPIHEKHKTSDVWESDVLAYLEKRPLSEDETTGSKCIRYATIANILTDGLEIEIAKCGPQEDKRVARILRRDGWEPIGRRKSPLTGNYERPWRKQGNSGGSGIS